MWYTIKSFLKVEKGGIHLFEVFKVEVPFMYSREKGKVVDFPFRKLHRLTNTWFVVSRHMLSDQVGHRTLKNFTKNRNRSVCSCLLLHSCLSLLV